MTSGTSSVPTRPDHEPTLRVRPGTDRLGRVLIPDTRRLCQVDAAGMLRTVRGTSRWRGRTRRTAHLEVGVVILGAILLIIGLIASLSILVWIGIILLVVGLVLNLVPIGGTRRRYY